LQTIKLGLKKKTEILRNLFANLSSHLIADCRSEIGQQLPELKIFMDSEIARKVRWANRKYSI